MKKALVILMVLAMVFGAFADDLAAVTLKGSASLTYEIDLDAEAYGMKNGGSASQEYTIQLVTKDLVKTTEGSGVWGELVVKSSEAKITQGGCANSAAATVDTAKIHLSDILAINILRPDLKLGKNGPAFITGDFTAETAGVSTDGVTGEGFTAEVTLDGVANINVSILDNGVKNADAKEIGLKATVDVKAVDNLTLWGGVAWNGDLDQGIAAAAKVGYTAGDLTVTAAFDMDYDEDKTLAAGVVYAFGGKAGTVDYIGGDGDGNCTNGVSVAVKTSDLKAFGLGAAVFKDAIIEGLKAGAEVIVADAANFAKGTTDFFAAGLAYSAKFGDFDFAAHAGAKMLLKPSDLGFKYGASIANSTLIQNVTLKAAYEGSQDAKIGGADKKGVIDLSASMSF